MQLAPTATAPDFAALHRDRLPPMFRLAYLLTGSQEVAEELVQDAFLRVHRKWPDVADHAAYLRRAVGGEGPRGCCPASLRGVIERVTSRRTRAHYAGPANTLVRNARAGREG